MEGFTPGHLTVLIQTPRKRFSWPWNCANNALTNLRCNRYNSGYLATPSVLTEVNSERSTSATRSQRTPRKKRPSYTVGFRLDSYYVSLLERGAAAYEISIHEYARQRLVELLDRQEETRLLEEASQTRVAVSSLREDLARTLEVLLANLTSADPKAIRDWISANLRRE